MKSMVALVRCDSYDEEAVFAAVQRGLQLLGGMEQFIKPGEAILLKPNVLVGDAPNKQIGPHPMVFKAVARLARDVTARLSYGDSSAVGRAVGNMRRAGLMEVAEALKIPLADFDNGRDVVFKESPFTKHFMLANGVLDADGLISVCKLKTHQLTRITGAVKNQFGCVPGQLKANFHIQLPNALDFARMLVVLNLYIRPRLYVMDGITAMQGNGPRNGSPFAMNAILLSADPVALDATASRMIALNPEFVPTAGPGKEWGLGTYLSEEIELLGDPLESFVNKAFDVVRSPVRPVTNSTFVPFFRNLVAPRPVIDPLACGLCGTCVKSCPATPKAVDWHSGDKTVAPTYKYERCVRCFCCQEVCPDQAISVKTPWLGKLFQPR